MTTSAPAPVLPPSVSLLDGPGSLPFLRVDAPGGSGDIFLHGAHLTSWRPKGQRDVLWMSDASRFTEQAPIRGGVPICFPWFNMNAADATAPQHGLVRISEWTVADVSEQGDAVAVRLSLSDTEARRASVWQHRFEANFTVSIGAALSLELEVVNRDDVPFSYEAALHNYYALADVKKTVVGGLEGLRYLEDTASGMEPEPIRLSGAISRRYPQATEGWIRDEAGGRVIRITSEGSQGVVLWNPGEAIARTMEDFSDDGWPGMLCFETCNIADSRIHLAPGQRHRMRARVDVDATDTP